MEAVVVVVLGVVFAFGAWLESRSRPSVPPAAASSDSTVCRDLCTTLGHLARARCDREAHARVMASRAAAAAATAVAAGLLASAATAALASAAANPLMWLLVAALPAIAVAAVLASTAAAGYAAQALFYSEVAASDAGKRRRDYTAGRARMVSVCGEEATRTCEASHPPCPAP